MAGDHILCVFMNPLDGREDELNDWYTRVHWPEVERAGMPADALTRYEAVAGTPDRKAAPYRYLMLYDLGDDPTVMEKIALARGSFTPPPDAVDVAGACTWMFRRCPDGP